MRGAAGVALSLLVHGGRRLGSIRLGFGLGQPDPHPQTQGRSRRHRGGFRAADGRIGGMDRLRYSLLSWESGALRVYAAFDLSGHPQLPSFSKNGTYFKDGGRGLERLACSPRIPSDAYSLQ